MDRELIIQALKTTCGNKNFCFQIVIQNSKLHIYINRRPDYEPNYSWLTDIVTSAIASLDLEPLSGIWLYSRKLGEVEPDWQTFVEFPQKFKSQDLDTISSDTPAQEEADVADFEFPATGGVDDTGLLQDARALRDRPLPEKKKADVADFEFPATDGVDDTGLLHNTGMIHGKPLQEEEIDTFTDKKTATSTSNPAATVNSLAKYCFVSNKKILTGDIIPPDKEIIRLVKFFHHLSDNQKHKILPALDEYFKNAKIPDAEKLAIAVKKWLKQIAELNEEDRRVLEIWLSRYCFDSTATLEEFKAVAEKEAARAEAAKKVKRSNTEYSFTPANTPTPRKSLDREQSDDLNNKKFQLPPLVQKSIIPLAWTFFTVILIFLAVYTGYSDARITSGQIPPLCQTSIGSPSYCRLGVNLAGEDTIEQLSQGIFPLTEITKTVADYGCQRYANVKAGALNNLDPQQNPVIPSYGEKIFPNIYVVEAVQKNATQPGNVRVACVYTTGAGERSPKTLATDVIPNNWPDEHYRQQSRSESNLSFGIYTNPINLGLYTLFFAIGMAIVSEFNLGIKITNRPQTIYLVALILGIVQLIAASLPVLNLLASIILPVFTILATAQLIKSFQINWNSSYSLIAAGILTIIAVQFLLYGISLKLINSLI